MNDTLQPILYSFRRCPYAMRARLAIAYSQVSVELREIVLRNKPQSMLNISPKGTVPVLLLTDGTVIDESIDIMRWVLSQNDPDCWYGAQYVAAIDKLIDENDTVFKPCLDRYKYADRYPEHSQEYYRSQCEQWFVKLNDLLGSNDGYLLTNQPTLADMALFPFIRQCAHVDLEWFEATSYEHLQCWLADLKSSALFSSSMTKYPAWKCGDPKTYFSG
ncbi:MULTISPECIES: glutathione S-transferase [unclassified Neptuniibacter]|uniref:glutathione S-transferase n=1 Tax=unclassified Neptuniibacter TaxID=2630693 RepID=UPI000C3F880B|nr:MULTISPECIES: glutathione S-transferase [unclassified Neptuniibacter]MAY42050.1 glutathione S-transferase [Oceanospirillaceae bacterium]